MIYWATDDQRLNCLSNSICRSASDNLYIYALNFIPNFSAISLRTFQIGWLQHRLQQDQKDQQRGYPAHYEIDGGIKARGHTAIVGDLVAQRPLRSKPSDEEHWEKGTHGKNTICGERVKKIENRISEYLYIIQTPERQRTERAEQKQRTHHDQRGRQSWLMETLLHKRYGYFRYGYRARERRHKKK